MKQYRITSANFVPQGETGDADAYMDLNELNELRRLAGMPVLEGEGAGPNGLGGVYNPQNNVTQTGDSYSQSPLGSNISVTARERNDLLREYCVQPGTDLWFIINFTLPLLNGSLRDHVERYLEQHPEYRPKHRAGEDGSIEFD